MWITLALMLPVTAILLWGYWYVLPRPRRFSIFDLALVGALLAATVAAFRWSAALDAGPVAPIWRDVSAAAFAYPIWAGGLGLGAVLRRRRGGAS